MRNRRLYEILALSRAFRSRAEESLRLLMDLPKLGPCLVSTSWGKDSTVLAHLALEAWGSVDLFHVEYLDALPGDEPVKAAALADPRVTYHEVPPRPLAEVVSWFQRVGLPHDRDSAAQADVVAEAKRGPAATWAADHGFAVTVLGLRAEENQRTRGVSLRTRGPVYRLKSGMWHANPLAWWTGRDVWAYIFSRDLAYNQRVYDAETHGLTRERIRSTGFLSPDGAADRGTAAWLRFHFPDQWVALCRDFPEMTSYA